MLRVISNVVIKRVDYTGIIIIIIILIILLVVKILFLPMLSFEYVAI